VSAPNTLRARRPQPQKRTFLKLILDAHCDQDGAGGDRF